LLALSDEQLIRAVAGHEGDALRRSLERQRTSEELERLEERGLGALCRHAAGYPPPLSELTDAPAVLFSRGRHARLAELTGGPSVAIVGSRRASTYGLKAAELIGRGLGAAGVPVVSGMALGIDAAAHEGCLDAGGLAVAVLAGGPERAYPRRHERLYERIADTGVVLSEMPPGTNAFRWSFPARNRIMAGLATLTLVVEAADPSGSLITADFARDLGRIVGAVPGPITSRLSRGGNGLLRDGAVPITCAEDLLDELFGAGLHGRSSREQGARAPDDPFLRRVLEAVERGHDIDRVALETGVTTSGVRAALGRLEASGHLSRAGLSGWERTLG
jgi:DNA processing protein